MEKKFYFMKLIGTRPTFPMDITEDERKIMAEHAQYWREKMAQGISHVFGPVMDPKGVYGMGVVSVEDEVMLQGLQESDPAIKGGLGHYEVYPMMTAVIPGSLG